MSFIQITGCQLACPPSLFSPQSFRLNKGSSSTYNSTYLGKNLRNISPKLIYATSEYHQAAPISLFGDGISKKWNEASPWKGLETGTNNFETGQSIEDVMTLQEYYHDGSGGGKYGGGKYGGGNGGGDGSSGDVEDEGPLGKCEESKQVMLLDTIRFVYLAGFAITKVLNSGAAAVFSSVFIELAVTCGSLLIVLVVAYLVAMRVFL